MKRFGLVLAITCGFSFIGALADTIIGPDVTLVVTNSEELGSSLLQIKDGTTLVFPGAEAGVAGFNEYTLTNVTSGGISYISPYGDFTRIIDSAYWASNRISETYTEYIYTGRWYIPEAGLYSFCENIDDNASLGIDGQMIFRDTRWNQPTCVQDIPLAAGWHGIEIRVFNGPSGGGVLGGFLSGILYSPSNDLISAENQANAFAFCDPGDGSVLRAAHNGHIGPKTLVEGTVVLKLADHDMAQPFRLPGGLMQLTNTTGAAQLVVDGADELVFGATSLFIDYPPFNLDVAFSNATPEACLTFRDLVTLYAWPTSCTWRVADNAMLALAGTNLLGTGDIVLTNHSITVLVPEAVTQDAVIRVQGTNLTAAIKPCQLDALGGWHGTEATITNDISLEGVNSTALFPVNSPCYLQGAITGTGTVNKTGNNRLEFLEPCDFVGDVICGGGNVVAFYHGTAGDSNNTVTVQNGTTLTFYPPGHQTDPTTAFIKTLVGDGTGALYIPAFQTMEIERFEGAITIHGVGALRIGTLAAGATLNVVTDRATVTIGAAEPGAAIRLSNSTSLAFTGSDTVLDSLYLNPGAFVVSGAATIKQISGPGTLIKQGSETLNVQFSSISDMRIEAGKITLAAPDPASVLGDLPALWLDAAAPDVFTQYQNYTFTNNFTVIERWNDCRPGAPYYGLNTRGDNNHQVYPYVMTNNQNGLPVVSMGAYQAALPPGYENPPWCESRRLPLSTALNPQYIVMMFGSQHGGGAAVVGGNWELRRGGATTADYRNPATPILAALHPAWINGVEVTATNTGFNGGYQILTLNTQGRTVNILGWRDGYQNAGGQNYGEVLIYTNALTDIERMTVEAYLAKKWALPYNANTHVPSVTVATGAELEIGRAFTVDRLHGGGTVHLADGSTFSPGGRFTGTLQLNGGTFDVVDLPVPPGPEVVPAAARSAWFDPSQTNRVVLVCANTPADRPLAVTGLLDREWDGLYLLGSCNVWGSPDDYDRRPWLDERVGPLGAPLFWLDYQNIYPNDAKGNTLRMMRNPAYLGTGHTQNVVTNVRTGFIVLDSSRGGGVPITYNVGANQVIRRDDPRSINSPIWGSKTVSAVRDAPTWLDGQPVNGATSGFTGKEELLSFAATDVFQAGYFGFYALGESPTDQNPERLGEIILFESALDDTTRASIEAYLMYKWLGKARDGYADFTTTCVDGTGTVTATTPDRLPTFADTFSGTVALSTDAFDFTIGTNALGQATVTPSLAIPGTLGVADSGTVNLHFASRPPAGLYPLITCDSFAGAGFATWALAVSGDAPAGNLTLAQSADTLSVRIASVGTLILLQ